MNRGHAQSGGRHAFASALRVAGEEGDTAYRSAEVAGWRWGLERVPYPRRSLWKDQMIRDIASQLFPETVHFLLPEAIRCGDDEINFQRERIAR